MAEEEQAQSVEEPQYVVVAKWPKIVTEPCARFLASSMEVFSLMQDFSQLARRLEGHLRDLSRDEAYRFGLRESYRQYRDAAENRDEYPEEIEVELLMHFIVGSIPRAEDIVSPHANLLNQMLLTRTVDNFNIYLSELLILMYRTKLGAMKSENSDIEEFIGRLAESYVERASFGGMRRLPKEFEDTFGVSLFSEKDERKKVERIIARRNIITHNRGIANRYFLKQVKDTGLKIGDAVPFTRDDVGEDVVFLRDFVQGLDKRVAEHCSLPRISHPPLQPPIEAASEEA